MSIFAKKLEDEDKPFSDLISEQRQKESIEIYRRGWAMSEATCVLDDCSPEDVIRMAERIYEWVYGERR
jgi:hypothetical protein